jgi:Phage integrase, N-terminal SAM-like domain
MFNTTASEYQDYVVFVESKALRGRSKVEYLRQVRKLGEHYAGRVLQGIGEREFFDYFIHRREVEKLRPSTLNQAVVALRMFYCDYLGKGAVGALSNSPGSPAAGRAHARGRCWRSSTIADCA